MISFLTRETLCFIVKFCSLCSILASIVACLKVGATESLNPACRIQLKVKSVHKARMTRKFSLLRSRYVKGFSKA